MKLLFANLAKTTLAASISTVSMSITVTDGSEFPSPGSNESFLLTLVSGVKTEIVRVSSRSGNTLTISERGLEDTTAQSFDIGSTASCRITAGMLTQFSTTFASSALTSLLAPKTMHNVGYITNVNDTAGSPIWVFRESDDIWALPGYTQIESGTVVGGTTSRVDGSGTGVTPANVTSTRYLIQLTSGTGAGQIRVISSISSNSYNLSAPLTTLQSSGDTYEVYEANSALLLGASSMLSTLSPAEIATLARRDENNTFTKAQRSSVTSVAGVTGSLTLDMDLSNDFNLTLTGATTLANPGNLVAGQSGLIRIINASPATTMAFGDKWKFPGGSTPSLTATAGAIDVLSYFAFTSNYIFTVMHSGVTQ